jgi:(S)-2-hydroxyglutarate dehydrogenase
MSPDRFDVVVVGAGIVGLATARELALAGRSVAVLEAEADVARHQTGHNSGVVHAGVYYKPGSYKARLVTEGREEMYRFLAERGIAHERCGKLVIAGKTADLPRLDELERRARSNGLTRLERLDAAGVLAREPHATGVAGLWVGETGIADFVAVGRAFAADVEARGGEVRRATAFLAARSGDGDVAIATSQGALRAGHLINCAGLQCDRVARRSGLRPPVRIVPFRGEYFELAVARRGLVRNLIYPVPDPAYPFLGVHLTRRVDGSVEAGPNAVVALARHGYARWRLSPRDAASVLLFPGFWHFVSRHLRMAAVELRRSGSRVRFARDLQELVPAIEARDLAAGGAGVRAQAMDAGGKLIDDFLFLDAPRQTHVLNAPSPGATASLAIGREIARRAGFATAN